ncbi:MULTISPECIES: transposase [Planktothricoides]|uniref:transposase n=1 Tax=Planktothricoides TaxID=132607 RepID=UPI00339BB876
MFHGSPLYSLLFHGSPLSWFTSFLFSLDVPVAPTDKIVDVVGIDLGIKALANLSTGACRKQSKKLAKLQRKVSRKVSGSANRHVGVHRKSQRESQ